MILSVICSFVGVSICLSCSIVTSLAGFFGYNKEDTSFSRFPRVEDCILARAKGNPFVSMLEQSAAGPRKFTG